MKIYMFTILHKAKPDTENIRDLNVAAVRYMIIEVMYVYIVYTELQIYTNI
jgi:hypothetical protein